MEFYELLVGRLAIQHPHYQDTKKDPKEFFVHSYSKATYDLVISERAEKNNNNNNNS